MGEVGSGVGVGEGGGWRRGGGRERGRRGWRVAGGWWLGSRERRRSVARQREVLVNGDSALEWRFE